jgi:two-component sensor histidine kinase
MTMETLYTNADKSDSFLLRVLFQIKDACATAISTCLFTANGGGNCEAVRSLATTLAQLCTSAEALRLLPRPVDGAVDFTATLTRLCRVIAASSELQSRQVALFLTFNEPIYLEPECAWRASVIVSELLHCACGHEFRPRVGSISVHVTEENDQVTCRVSDDGCPRLVDDLDIGRPISHALAIDIDASIRRSSSKVGSNSIVSFPRRRPHGRPDGGVAYRANAR